MFTLLKISGPLQNTFRSLNRLRGGLPEIKDALDLLELKPERLLLSSPGVPTPDGLMPRRLIQLKDVSFSYRRSDRPVLDSVNISIPIGSRFALVGRTGSGKTTIAHLLLGLLQPTSGQLMLDGIPVSPQIQHGRPIALWFLRTFDCLMEVFEITLLSAWIWN